MSDEGIRELERRWRETQSPEDEAAWLRQRLRTGDLTEDRLRLAAYCQHPAAVLLVPQPSPGWVSQTGAWLKETILGHRVVPGLRPWGAEACVRGMIAAARLVVPICEQHLRPDPRPVQAVVAAEEWVLDQSDVTRQRAAQVAAAADASFAWFSGAGGNPPPGVTGAPPQFFGTEQLSSIVACIAPARAIEGDMNMNVEGAAAAALDFFSGGAKHALLDVQHAVRRELAQWALALGEDPIRRRRGNSA